MAGVSRHMARSLVSSARAAGRFCGSKGASGGGDIGAAARGGLSSAAAPRSAPSPSFSSPRSFFMESRRPGAFFGRLPGEVAMVQSLLPLHAATASARMVSQLRSSAGALLQERLDTLLSYCRRACFHADLLLRSTQDLVVGKLTAWAAEPIPSVRSEISARAEDSHGNSLSFGDSTRTLDY